MAAVDIEYAKRASLSLDSIDAEAPAVPVALLSNASSAGAVCFIRFSGGGIFPAALVDVSTSSRADVRVVAGVVSLSLGLEVTSGTSRPVSSCDCCIFLSSSSGQVVWAILGSTEIAVGGE